MLTCLKPRTGPATRGDVSIRQLKVKKEERTCTCFFARTDDVKIVRSRDAQSNTEESP